MSVFTPEQVARVCHEANRVVQRITGDPHPSVAWDQAPVWQRASALVGVQKAREGATPEELHESWVQEKIADGWIYGIEKSQSNKTHPCLVPYRDLPEEQQAKDVLFHAIVGALS